MDKDYKDLNSNAIKIALIAKKNFEVIRSKSNQIKSFKTEAEAEVFYKANGIAELITINKENQKILAVLQERYPKIADIDKVELGKMNEVLIKEKMEMGYYDGNGIYIPYDEYTDTVVTKGPIDFCYDTFVAEEQRCFRDFTVEMTFAVIAAGFGGYPGLIVMGHGVVVLNICKYDADMNFEACVKQAGG